MPSMIDVISVVDRLYESVFDKDNIDAVIILSSVQSHFGDLESSTALTITVNSRLRELISGRARPFDKDEIVAVPELPSSKNETEKEELVAAASVSPEKDVIE